MNPSTHAHRFESPGFHKWNVTYQNLLRSADQSLPHEHFLMTRSSISVHQIGIW